MAIPVRRVPGFVLPAAIAIAHNKLCAQAALVGALFHADITSTPTGDGFIAPSFASLQTSLANATDLPTAIALATQLIGMLKAHLADGIASDPYFAGAHKIVDSVNAALVPAIPTDLTSLQSSLNTLKSTLNAHFSQANVHFNNDGTNTVAASNASDLATSITLVNAIKTSLNAHITSAPTNPMVKISNP